MGDTIRVSIVVQIEVDRAAYDAEYGESATVKDIRDHVKGAAVTAVESAFENIEAVKVTDWR